MEKLGRHVAVARSEQKTAKHQPLARWTQASVAQNLCEVRYREARNDMVVFHNRFSFVVNEDTQVYGLPTHSARA
jgi:hypothetical protein